MISCHWFDLHAGYVSGPVVVYGGPQAQNYTAADAGSAAAVVGDRRAGTVANWTIVSGRGLEERDGGVDDEVAGLVAGLLTFRLRL
jgi:hypothetical protein